MLVGGQQKCWLGSHVPLCAHVHTHARGARQHPAQHTHESDEARGGALHPAQHTHESDEAHAALIARPLCPCCTRSSRRKTLRPARFSPPCPSCTASWAWPTSSRCARYSWTCTRPPMRSCPPWLDCRLCCPTSMRECAARARMFCVACVCVCAVRVHVLRVRACVACVACACVRMCVCKRAQTYACCVTVFKVYQTLGTGESLSVGMDQSLRVCGSQWRALV